MNDKLHTYFTENDFDIHNPNNGHENRFLEKLQHSKKKTFSFKWLGVAASILLLLGFYLGNMHQKDQYDLKNVSPKMAEAQSFFVSTINQELKEIEKYRNLETEKLIEDALEEIEELEDEYKTFKIDLKTQGNQRLKIKAMINNYQQRLEVLERLLEQLNTLQTNTKPNIEEHEII